MVASLRIISPGLQFTLSLAGGRRWSLSGAVQHLACLSCGLRIVDCVDCAASLLCRVWFGSLFTGAHSALDLSGRGCPGRQPPPLSFPPRSFFGLFFFFSRGSHSAQLNPVKPVQASM